MLIFLSQLVRLLTDGIVARSFTHGRLSFSSYFNYLPYSNQLDNIMQINHCVKRVRIRIFFLGRFFPHSCSPNTGKYRPEKTLYLDTFHEVKRLRYTKICGERFFMTYEYCPGKSEKLEPQWSPRAVLPLCLLFRSSSPKLF